MADGLLDTNVFIHAHTTDAHSQECRAFLRGLEQGSLSARLEAVVVHELSYALPHYMKQMKRSDVGQYLLTVLSWPGIHADKDLLIGATGRWQQTPGLSFVDAYLAESAAVQNVAVLT